MYQASAPKKTATSLGRSFYCTKQRWVRAVKNPAALPVRTAVWFFLIKAFRLDLLRHIHRLSEEQDASAQ